MRRFLLVLVFLAFMVACGGSPHDRAEAVMESVVESLLVQHDRLDGLLSSVEERSRGACDAVRPQTDITLPWGKASDIREAMRAASRDYTRGRTECLSSLNIISNQLTGAREVQEYLTAETLARHVTSLRARFATVTPDALERVLDAAGTDDEAWVALNQVNPSGGRQERGADAWASSISDLEELLEGELEDISSSIVLAQENWHKFHELAGVPVPEP